MSRGRGVKPAAAVKGRRTASAVPDVRARFQKCTRPRPNGRGLRYERPMAAHGGAWYAPCFDMPTPKPSTQPPRQSEGTTMKGHYVTRLVTLTLAATLAASTASAASHVKAGLVSTGKDPDARGHASLVVRGSKGKLAVSAHRLNGAAT